MLRHAIQRLILAIPVMFGVLLIGFLLMQVVPTDPATVRAGPTATPDVIAAIRADLGLDEPLYKQFGLYVWRLVQGDLGSSIINNVPVSQELGATLVHRALGRTRNHELGQLGKHGVMVFYQETRRLDARTQVDERRLADQAHPRATPDR